MVHIGDRYRHYKNGHSYIVIAIACGKITDVEEKMVVYQAMYDCPELAEDYGVRPVFVRRYDDFVQKVDNNGHLTHRFEKIII